MKKLIKIKDVILSLLVAYKKSVAKERRRRYLLRNHVVMIGEHTYGSPNVYHWGDETKLRIGKYCSIADDVVILLGGEHRIDWTTTYPFSAFSSLWGQSSRVSGHPVSKGDVIIGNDVWIGHGAVILSGVSIGDGAVIGAGSIVTRSVPDYGIVAGNPAKVIKFRFGPDVIESLQKLQWWNWDEKKITESIPILMSKPNI